MESIFLLPIVVPFTILNPFILINMIIGATRKRVRGEKYGKDMVSIVMLLVCYIMFLALFF